MKIALIIIAVIAINLFFLILSYFICNEMLFKRFFGRPKEDAEKRAMRDSHYSPVRQQILAVTEKLKSEDKTEVFIVARDGIKLVADYFDRKSDTTVIFFHGFHGVPPHNFGVIEKGALDKGYNVLVVDQRAHFRSEGKLFSYGFIEQYDALSWIDWIDKNAPVKNVFLYGSSAGAATICFASDKIEGDRVRGAISDCGFVSTLELVNNICANKKLPDFIFLNYIRRKAKKRLGLDMEKDRVTDSLLKTRVPFLFLHGSLDDVAPPTGTKTLYESCNSEKEIFFVEDAGHTTATVFGGEKTTGLILDFIKKHSVSE